MVCMDMHHFARLKQKVAYQIEACDMCSLCCLLSKLYNTCVEVQKSLCTLFHESHLDATKLFNWLRLSNLTT